MTGWPPDWRPIDAEEAQEYLEVHWNGSGDPELIEECCTLLDERMPSPERSHALGLPFLAFLTGGAIGAVLTLFLLAHRGRVDPGGHRRPTAEVPRVISG
jgi:hypothetical protein